jgi:hypothetical protein
MAPEKKFVPGKGMVPAGKAADAKKEAVPPKKGAKPPAKAPAKPPAKAPAKKAVPPKKK